jgi:predicted dehydrogenase
MERINVGIIGMGYIGVSHMEALRRIGFTRLSAVADTNSELARAKAEEFSIPRSYDSIDALLADPEIQVVHNCTPNALHTEVNRRILQAGKHLLSEKPLAMNSTETAGLLALLRQHPQLVAGVNFNYRMNPQVQQVRQMVRGGELGDIRLVHGCYLQDWLLYDTDYNWRIEPEVGGPSRCIADIGSHWMDIIQHITGARIVSVCADLVTALPTRKKARGQVETFSRQQDTEYEEVPVRTEDYGAVLIKMDNGVSGVFYVSEISAGHGCYFDFEINGSKASAAWNQERADELWIGRRDAPNQLMLRDPGTMAPGVSQPGALAKGHPEGWNDAFTSNIRRFHTFIAQGKRLGTDQPDFATFEDAHYIIRLTEAILDSARTRQWVNIPTQEEKA